MSTCNKCEVCPTHHSLRADCTPEKRKKIDDDMTKSLIRIEELLTSWENNQPKTA